MNCIIVIIEFLPLSNDYNIDSVLDIYTFFLSKHKRFRLSLISF